MKFLCLAYGAEKDWKALTKDEQDALLAQDEVLRKRGALMAAVEPAVAVLRPHARVLLITSDEGDLSELLTALRA